tara:strand:- start:1046 stop:2161 length:1116 start_codon:yes stop_codon:yes gene_type:complete
MAESPPEYTVRDYSAVDKQIEEVARREKTLTDRMRIQNYAKLAIIAGGLMLVAGILFVLISWGIRIMKGAPEIRIIESRGTNQEERTTDNQDVRQIFENEEKKDSILTQNKERILNIYDERIRNLEDENQQLNTYMEQEEKRVNNEISEIKEKKQNLQSEINKKYEMQETILVERLDNQKKSLQGLESEGAQPGEINALKNEIEETNQEIGGIQERKKDDLNQSIERLDKEVEKKNQTINEIKQETRKKITDNKQAIASENKEKKEELAKINEQITSNQNVKKDVTMFKQVPIRDKIFDTVVTRHKYNSSNLDRPSEESCYASKPQGGGQQLLELADKDNFSKVKSRYNVNNNYGLSQAQWANYITYCQWY